MKAREWLALIWDERQHLEKGPEAELQCLSCLDEIYMAWNIQGAHRECVLEHFQEW